jgi:chromosome segregation ATPase
MQPMTEDRLKELLTTSECKDSFDSAIVRELFVEFDQLHSVPNELDRIKPDLENKVARLTESLEQLPNEIATKEKQLRSELAMMEKQYRDARETIDKQNDRFKLVCRLLISCLDHIRNAKTADYIKNVEKCLT